MTTRCTAQTRKFGLVYAATSSTSTSSTRPLAKYGVKIAPGADDHATRGPRRPLGDPTVAQEQAPVAIAKLKSAGVTSVILLADAAMTAR